MKFLTEVMKKTAIMLCMTSMLFAGCFMIAGIPVRAAEASSGEEIDIEEFLSGVEEKVSEALSEIDEEEMSEIFEFVKEKVADGSLRSEEGLKAAIEEGEDKFDVTIDESVAQQVVDAMEKLEDMGFSGEEIISKAQNLYNTYGADFLSHANEAFAEVVEEAVENAVASFFSNLWEDVKTSVKNLFKSWF